MRSSIFTAFQPSMLVSPRCLPVMLSVQRSSLFNQVTFCFSRIAPHIRRAWVVEEGTEKRLIASGEWIVFRGAAIKSQYLRYFLLGDPFHAQFMQTVAGVGGSLLRARQTEVAKIEVPLPPLAEQERIVRILDEAEAVRRLRAQADQQTSILCRRCSTRFSAILQAIRSSGLCSKCHTLFVSSKPAVASRQ